jgi:hypothetical protein
MQCPTESRDAKYRTVEEARIVELLLLHGWASEIRRGGRLQAEREVRAALDQFVTLGLPFRESETGGRLFDPVEAVNFVRWAWFRHKDRTLIDRCVPTARQLVCEAHRNGDRRGLPPSPGSLGPRRYTVVIKRTFNLENRRPGERLRLRLPLPIESTALGDLETAFLPPEGLETDTVYAPARLDVLIAGRAEREVTIGVRTKFTARPFAPAHPGLMLDPAEAELYTRPSEGLIKISNRVRSLAEDLAGVGVSPCMALREFWNFIFDQLACGAVHYDQFDPAQPLDWVLEHGWYDCQLGSALFVALCRARGIPARLVSGYLLHTAAPAFHSWLEVWVEEQGWVPLDLFSWDLSFGGRDAGWRNYFFGQLDHRMIVERRPLLFNGTGTVRLPRAWHRLVAPDGPGSAVEFRALGTGALVYREYIQVQPVDDANHPT